MFETKRDARNGIRGARAVFQLWRTIKASMGFSDGITEMIFLFSIGFEPGMNETFFFEL